MKRFIILRNGAPGFTKGRQKLTYRVMLPFILLNGRAEEIKFLQTRIIRRRVLIRTKEQFINSFQYSTIVSFILNMCHNPSLIYVLQY